MAASIASVHPHACGEYALADVSAPKKHGSPPRLWGILLRSGQHDLLARFTPTPVGNTGDNTTLEALTAVHPHACGEYIKLAGVWHAYGGSPPRLWGILRSTANVFEAARFTPTPVGNTSCAMLTFSRSAVHPHACGEYW